jgi:hypothetical protein
VIERAKSAELDWCERGRDGREGVCLSASLSESSQCVREIGERETLYGVCFSESLMDFSNEGA